MADQDEEQAVDAGEQRKERAAAGCLLVIAVGTGGCVAVAVPETAYYAAGLFTFVVVRKVRGWVTGRRGETAEEPEEAEPLDVVAVLQKLGAGGEHVRLTQLQEAAGLPDTKTVRALLDEARIPVRSGVRAGGKNGPGVHAADIPPIETPHEPGCLCRSGANTNANNEVGEGPRKGFRVEHTGHAGTTVYDLSETHRHHAKTR